MNHVYILKYHISLVESFTPSCWIVSMELRSTDISLLSSSLLSSCYQSATISCLTSLVSINVHVIPAIWCIVDRNMSTETTELFKRRFFKPKTEFRVTYWTGSLIVLHLYANHVENKYNHIFVYRVDFIRNL